MEPHNRPSAGRPANVRTALLVMLCIAACGDGGHPGQSAGVAAVASGQPAGAVAPPPTNPNPASAPMSDATELEALQLTVGDLTFDATAIGPVDGDLVMLLHGFPQTSFQWRSQQRALAAAGYRAVAPNQRGYSAGARPAEVAQYTLPLLVDDVLGMADALGRQRFHVVGHDWGGAVAWSVALSAPARVATVSVLSTPHPDALSAALADTTSCQYQASAYFDDLSSPDATVTDLAKIEGAGFEKLPPESLMHYTQNVLSKPEVFQAALNWYRANVQNRVLGTGQPQGVTAMPTLYMWGTADVTFCREPAEDSANFSHPDYTFVPVEGAGHWLSELNADAVNAALLDRLSAP